MLNVKRLLIVLAAMSALLSGCNGKAQEKILAKVNGMPITAEDVAFRLDLGHGNKPQYGDKSIDDIINQELLYQQGVRLGLDQDPSYQRLLVKLNSAPAGARRLEMARRVFNTEIAAKVDVTYQEGQDYFEKHAEQIAAQLHLEMIKFAKRSQAEEALKRLRGGASIEEIARPLMGETPVQGRKPWDLGFVGWQQIPVDFTTRIYTLKPGEVSEVLGSRATGFQVVKLIEIRKGARTGYPALSATVMNRLRDLKLLQAYARYVETLRKEAKIVTF